MDDIKEKVKRDLGIVVAMNNGLDVMIVADKFNVSVPTIRKICSQSPLYDEEKRKIARKANISYSKKGESKELKNYKRKTLKGAYELGYPSSVNEKIRNANSISEISRIMRDARHGMYA